MTKPILIYSTAICPYCVAAKSFLTARHLPYTEYRVDLDPARWAEMLERSGGRKSVPQIFVGDKHVGGYEQLVGLARAGELEALLEAGA